MITRGAVDLSQFTPKDVLDFHTKDDVDSGQLAHHHTLGKSSNQAAPGNHSHDRIDQAGSVFISSPVSIVGVVFDEPFDVAPVVTATFTIGGNVALIPNLEVINTGFNAYIYGIGGTWSSGAVSLYWHATPYSS